MMLPELSIGKYLFTFRAEERIKMPAFKGSVFHGVFGQALMDLSPYWYQYFFQPGNNQAPKPYVILPPLDTSVIYDEGHEFSCEMTLLGQAAQHWSVCHCALDYGVRRLGIGKGRAKAAAWDIGVARLDSDESVLSRAPQVTSSQIVNSRIAQLPKRTIRITFVSRIRLKARNKLVTQPPSFSIFFARLLGRLKSLCHFFCEGRWLEPEQEQELLLLAESVNTVEHDLYWDDWSRYSNRQRSWMKFGGLLGAVTYQGELEPFLPFLAVGEWIHVGGKTTFGLGKYVISGGGKENARQEAHKTYLRQS